MIKMLSIFTYIYWEHILKTTEIIYIQPFTQMGKNTTLSNNQ